MHVALQSVDHGDAATDHETQKIHKGGDAVRVPDVYKKFLAARRGMVNLRLDNFLKVTDSQSVERTA